MTVNGEVNVVDSYETSSVHQSQLPMQSSWGKMCGCRRTEKKNAKSVRQGPPNLPQADDMCDSHW